jgi:preprotein translocase subunit SecE
LAAATGLVWFSWYGREFRQFAQASRIELRKVVWPEREDTIKTTYIVIGFAILMGLFFWGLDWVLTWMIRLLTGQPPA